MNEKNKFLANKKNGLVRNSEKGSTIMDSDSTYHSFLPIPCPMGRWSSARPTNTYFRSFSLMNNE